MTRSIHKRISAGCAAALLGCAVFAPSLAWSQDCGCQEAYRIVYKTVYDQQPITTYRLTYETEMVERPITVQKQVWDTEVRVRKYTVAKPVTETSEHVEDVKVMQQVWETGLQEYAYDRVTYQEETRYRTERVQKPVYETAEQKQQYTERVAMEETVMQPQQHTVYEPVTTMATQYVDQGGYVDQTTVVPGAVRNRLQWIPGGYSVSGATGLPYNHRGGLHWVPTQAPAIATTNRVYVPNVVAQQVPQTQMVAKVVNSEVAVKRIRYEDVVRTRKVPVQTVRYEIEERQIPYTVQKPVTERIVEQKPVRTCKWVEKIETRRTPITVQKIVYEEHEEEIPVKVCRLVTEERVIQEPRTVAKWVGTDGTRLTPRVVAMRVPLDGCGQPIESHYMPGDTSTTRKIIVERKPVEAKRPMKVEMQPMEEAEKKPMIRTEKPMADEGTDAEPSEAEKAAEEAKAAEGSSIKPKTTLDPRKKT